MALPAKPAVAGACYKKRLTRLATIKAIASSGKQRPNRGVVTGVFSVRLQPVQGLQAPWPAYVDQTTHQAAATAHRQFVGAGSAAPHFGRIEIAVDGPATDCLIRPGRAGRGEAETVEITGDAIDFTFRSPYAALATAVAENPSIFMPSHYGNVLRHMLGWWVWRALTEQQEKDDISPRHARLLGELRDALANDTLIPQLSTHPL